MILIMYTKNLYTLLHSMNGGFIFSSQTRAVFSLTFTFQVYGANKKKTSSRCFRLLGNNAKMSVEFVGKQNT